MIDQIDEDIVFFERIGNVVKGRDPLAAGDGVEPVVLARGGPVVEGPLQARQLFALHGVFQQQIALFFPLPHLFVYRSGHSNSFCLPASCLNGTISAPLTQVVYAI